MARATKERAREAALKMANHVRKEMGFPPVSRLYPGKPGQGSSCAITETIYDDDVDRSLWSVYTSNGIVRFSRFGGLGQYVSWKKVPGTASFVYYFDQRQYPDLIKR